MANKKTVLILCTGNSCRSQMAEGLINYHLGKEWQAFSAGTHPSTVNPYSIRAMEALGIDISQNTSDNLSQYQNQAFDWVITVCGDAEDRCPIFPGDTQKIHIGFDDPAHATGTEAEIMAQFTRVRDEIKVGILGFLKAQ